MSSKQAVLRSLPWLYAAIVLVEVAYLGRRYAIDPPAPSAAFSIGLGWGALGSMALLLIYSTARRSVGLRRVLDLCYWLHFHIFLGVQGVVLALFHSSHVFFTDRAVNLFNPAMINLLAVIVVFCSGVYGRYLYGMLHDTRVDRIFRRWILFHRPLAACVYLITIVHVTLSYMFAPSLGR